MATTLLATVSDGEGKGEGEDAYEGEAKAEKRSNKTEAAGSRYTSTARTERMRQPPLVYRLLQYLEALKTP